MVQLPNYAEPATGLEAKFSAEYAAAVALTDKAGGVAQFSDRRVGDPLVTALCRKVKLSADAALKPYQVRAVVRTSDGREFTRFIEAQKGDPRNPLSAGDILAKFEANAATVLKPSQVAALAGQIQRLEAVADAADLTRLCAPGRT
jgi:2-methylcitrate dehydratase PrpD